VQPTNVTHITHATHMSSAPGRIRPNSRGPISPRVAALSGTCNDTTSASASSASSSDRGEEDVTPRTCSREKRRLRTHASGHMRACGGRGKARDARAGGSCLVGVEVEAARWVWAAVCGVVGLQITCMERPCAASARQRPMRPRPTMPCAAASEGGAWAALQTAIAQVRQHVCGCRRTSMGRAPRLEERDMRALERAAHER
jgi:hypothetical protein